jgi:hypothetical protein
MPVKKAAELLFLQKLRNFPLFLLYQKNRGTASLIYMVFLFRRKKIPNIDGADSFAYNKKSCNLFSNILEE